MLLFDALIFNTDRHQDNWGICRKEGNLRLAPAYDNSSSLGWNLSDQYFESIYEDPQRLEMFIYRSPTHIGYNHTTKRKHFELMQHLKQVEPVLFSSSLEKIEILTEQLIQDIVNNIPEELMSDLRKKIIIEILWKRRNLLLEMR